VRSATTPALAATVQTAWPAATPPAVAIPFRRPPATVLRMVSAVSWPGVQMTTAETATNASRLSSIKRKYRFAQLVDDLTMQPPRALTGVMNVRAHVSVLVVVVLWAGSFSVIKKLLDGGVAAGDIAILRYAIAVPGFAYVLWRARGLPGLTRGDAARVAAAGLLVVVGYHMFLNVGTRHTTSGIAALVVALAPGLTMLLAFALGLDRISRRRIVGLTVAFAGVAIVVALGSGADVSVESAKGPLIVLGAPLAFALYNVILKPLLGRHDLLALTAATSLVGTLGLAPFARASTVDTVADASASEAALLLYLGVLATLLGYILWNAGLKGLGPTRAVTYAYAIPPLAVTFGAVFLDEPVTLWLALGGALVVGGIAAAQGVQLSSRLVSLRTWRGARSPSAS
jgi:drug/metabolite transporter (DMT)-like permease